MATDVARLSFDPARFYRGVVAQQGRVSLEAEQNEQRVIDGEQRRRELLDIVGPAGTPDDGYAVSSSGTGTELTIGAGTMYVGGWRVELDGDLDEDDQHDWLDRDGDEVGRGREHVLLWLQDTDVTAVEDPALYEVALGGPDGAGRTRLLQHVVLLPTEGATCAEALQEDRKRWIGEGLVFDPASMELESNSRLLVTWEGDPEPADPCEPSSTGGYLGAEHQLVRVQLTAAGQDGTFDFVWGFDDASFLYRVTADASTNPVLTLDRAPVDDYHRPRAGQAVQALRATAALQSTDGVVEGYVAALGGQVAVLAAPYDPDTKTVQFPAPLPVEYTDEKANPQLYLRIWEELVTGAEIGKPVSLTGTGMQITITAADQGRLHEDDYWCIAVRPTTPTTVYPDRYLRTPQPPDGPHQWVCPLAVIEWQDEKFVLLEDCRHHFGPLVDLERDGCCTVEVRPSDAAAGRLQTVLDKAAAGRSVNQRSSRVTVCFAPGRYELTEPLVLRKQHSNLTLRGCNDAAVVTVAAGREAEFGQGMVLLVDVDNVTITGFEFTMPQVPAVIARAQGTTGGVFDREVVRAINAEVTNRYVSIAIRPVNCAVLEIDRCLFRFTLGEHETTPADAQTMPRAVFGVGVFAAGGAWGLRLTRNRFLHDPTVPKVEDGPVHVLTGYLLTPTAASRTASSKTRALGAGRLRALIDDAEFAGNEFHGLSAAVVVAAELGDVRVWDNVVEDCYGGIWLVDVAAVANTSLADRGQLVGRAGAAGGLAFESLSGGLLDPILVQLLVAAMLFPLPRRGDLEPSGAVHFEGEQVDALRERSAERQQAFMSDLAQRLVTEHPAAEGQEDSADDGRPELATEALSRNVATIWSGLTELARLDQGGGELPSAVSVERNAVDCGVSRGRWTGPALFVFTALRDGPTASLTSNRLTSRTALITAAVVGASVATVTANTVVGDRERTVALGVVSVGAAAITGNVVVGRAVLPENRPFPAPLDTWWPFNTLV